MKPKDKRMSDGEVGDFAFKKLIGDLDGIEAKRMFDEDDDTSMDMGPGDDSSHSTTMKGPGYTIEVKHGMEGKQTKEEPMPMDKMDEEDEDKE